MTETLTAVEVCCCGNCASAGHPKEVIRPLTAEEIAQREADDVPYALVACTVYVYCVDEARPVTVIGLDDPVKVVGDVEGLGVTIKLVGNPPFEFKVNCTDACPLL